MMYIIIINYRVIQKLLKVDYLFIHGIIALIDIFKLGTY